MNRKSPKILSFPEFSDERGSLSSVEGSTHIPFDIKRVFYIYNVPENKNRGGHAHKKCEQVVIVLNGSFDVIVDDGKTKALYKLKKPNEALYIPNGFWNEVENFSKNSSCLVLCSKTYDENDYIREYEDFVDFVK